MPLEIPAGYAQAIVTLKHVALARPAGVTFGIGDGVGTITAAEANLALARFVTAFKARITSEVTIGPLTLRVGPGPEYLTYVSSTGNTNGTQSGETVPANCAILLHKRTARGGRRGRGRMYVPWAVNEGLVGETGQVTGSDITAWNTAAAAWLVDQAGGGMPVCLLHNTEGPEPGPPDEVVTMECDSVIGTQRRRLRG